MIKIEQDPENHIVRIDGKRISGFVDEGVCPECKCNRIYSYDYDAYFCARCDVWLECACDDPSCDYCKDRPANPSMIEGG